MIIYLGQKPGWFIGIPLKGMLKDLRTASPKNQPK